MKTPLLLLSLLLFLNVGAQKMERYEGKFPNNQRENATANYGFYKNAQGQMIKHGSFRYLVKIKSPERRLTRNIQGEYKDGWKNGQWSYAFSTKDYNVKNDGFFYSYNISVVANYENGYPDGEWKCIAHIKRRKSVRKDGKQKWSAYEIVQDVIIKMNYNKGLLIDSLNVYDATGHKVMAFMDQSGFLQGDFIGNGQNSKSELYFQDGFKFSSRNIEENSVENANYKYFKKNMNSTEMAGVQVDTLSMLQSKNSVITKLLNENIFNDSFFNFQYIDGDRLISFVGSWKKLECDYRGLYMRQTKVYISSEEQALIQRVYSFRSSVNSQVQSCKKAYDSSNGSAESKKNYERVKRSQQLLNGNIKQLEVYKSTFSPELILNNSYYKELKNSSTDIVTRRQILNWVYNKARKTSLDAKTVKCN